MVEQQGVVVAVEDGDAWVRVGGQSGCPACDEGRGCGAGLFGRLLQRGEARVRVANRLGVRPGQAVTLGLREADFLSLVLRLYGLPLLAGLGGALGAWAIAAPRLGTAGWAIDLACAAGACLVGGLVLRHVRRGLAGRFTDLSPEMLDPTVHLECASFDRTE